jgi:hypothetical protein
MEIWKILYNGPGAGYGSSEKIVSWDKKLVLSRSIFHFWEIFKILKN